MIRSAPPALRAATAPSLVDTTEGGAGVSETPGPPPGWVGDLDRTLLDLGVAESWLLWTKLGAGVLLALAVHWVLLRAVRAGLGRLGRGDAAGRLRAVRWPSAIIAALIGARVAWGWVWRVDEAARELIAVSMTVAAVIAGAWLLIAAGRLVQDITLRKHRLDVKDNLDARRLHTQFKVIRQAFNVLVVVVAAAVVLMQFEPVRQLGTGLLASAGVAGLALGIAARPVLENLFAGLQIALTQPIRIDDVVIIDGEWGWIEEITTTYVVVKIWDQRRLIVPFSKFISEPFQNWTRNRADILGSVTLSLGYNAPLAEMRAEFRRLLDESGLWDGRAQVLQVIDAGERSITVRALMSAADSPTAWDLRCFVREGLIRFLQAEHPEALPVVRVRHLDDQGPTGRGPASGGPDGAGRGAGHAAATSRNEPPVRTDEMRATDAMEPPPPPPPPVLEDGETSPHGRR